MAPVPINQSSSSESSKTLTERVLKCLSGEREINELSLPSIPFVLMAAEPGSCCLERESEAAEGTLIHALNSFLTILSQ